MTDLNTLWGQIRCLDDLVTPLLAFGDELPMGVRRDLVEAERLVSQISVPGCLQWTVVKYSAKENPDDLATQQKAKPWPYLAFTDAKCAHEWRDFMDDYYRGHDDQWRVELRFVDKAHYLTRDEDRPVGFDYNPSSLHRGQRTPMQRWCCDWPKGHSQHHKKIHSQFGAGWVWTKKIDVQDGEPFQ